jgi:hypothetical protein
MPSPRRLKVGDRVGGATRSSGTNQIELGKLASPYSCAGTASKRPEG